MHKHISLLMVALLIAATYLPCIAVVPAKAQGSGTYNTKFGMNAEVSSFNGDMAFSDLFVGATWNYYPHSGPWTANGYPSQPNGNAQLSGYACGYPDMVYHFYGEGIWSLGNNGLGFGLVSSKISNFDNTSQKTAQGAPITTFDVKLGFATTDPSQESSYEIITGMIGFQIQNINPQGLANCYPNNFHLIYPEPDNSVPAWQSGDDWQAPVGSGNFPVFTQEYLKSFAPFCEIRFMDWMQTNLGYPSIAVTDPPFTWACAPPPMNYVGPSSYLNLNQTVISAQYPNAGCQYRNAGYLNMVLLCNLTGCDMWINVPTLATTDWLYNFAGLVKNHLNPWLHCYYEHSNEMWNWAQAFGQWKLVEDWDSQFVTNPGPNPINSAGSWFRHGEEMGYLILSDAMVMQPILGDMGRPLLEGQYGDNVSYIPGGLYFISNATANGTVQSDGNGGYTFTQGGSSSPGPVPFTPPPGVSFTNGQQICVVNGQLFTGGAPSSYLYGIGVAPYMGPRDNTGWLNNNNWQAFVTNLNATGNIARQYGLKFCCYEGGDYVGYSSGLSDPTVWTMENDPNMLIWYQQYVAALQSGQVDRMNFFTNVQLWNGSCWGYLPSGAFINFPPLKYQAAAAAGAGCNCGNAQPAPAVSPPSGSSSSSSSRLPSPSPSPSPVNQVAPSGTAPQPTFIPTQ